MAYLVMTCILLACIAMAYIVMAYIGMACIDMAYMVMACVIMAYIVMAPRCLVDALVRWAKPATLGLVPPRRNLLQRLVYVTDDL